MPSVYYTCNLFPVGLAVESGYSPRWLGNHLEDVAAPARREALSIHPMTCPYVTQLVLAADVLLSDAAEEDCLIVPGGCDAMRRMGDLMAATYPGKVFVLAMPRSSVPGAVSTLAADLRSLATWLKGRLPDGAEDLCAAGEPPTVDYPSSPRPDGTFIVAGPLSDASLLRMVKDLGVHIAALESCTSPDRWKRLADETAIQLALSDQDPTTFETLAVRLLDIGMCPRRSTSERREYLAGRLDEAHPTSVIYARQSFCDPGAYDALLVAQLAEERGLPFLEIEVGFPFEVGGPLRTRVEAFLEAQLLDDDLLGNDLDDPNVDDLLFEED